MTSLVHSYDIHIILFQSMHNRLYSQINKQNYYCHYTKNISYHKCSKTQVLYLKLLLAILTTFIQLIASP